MTDRRVCECGCGESLVGRRANVRYLNERHRQVAYRRRLRKALAKAGLPDRLNLRTADTTGNRLGDGPVARRAAQTTRKRTPDMRLGYAKVLEAVAQDFVRVAGFDQRYARRRAAETLAPLLSDRQRAHLEGRSA